MIKIPYKQIVISLVTLITLHYTEAQANPFLELKKMLKNQGQSNTSQTSSSTPQPAQTPSSSAQSNPIEDGDDDMKSKYKRCLPNHNNPEARALEKEQVITKYNTI